MNWVQKTIQLSSPVARYRFRKIIVISLAWTVTDLFLYFLNVSSGSDVDYPYTENRLSAYLLRSAFVFIVSFLMSWLLLQELRTMFRTYSLLAGWIIKACLLLVIAFCATVLLFFLHYLIIRGDSFNEALEGFRHYFLHTRLMTRSLLFWLVMLLSAQIIVEVDQKYSPGIFWEIVSGKYLKPRNEKRIIMFLDLKDSTPISEQLGHEKYFLFIKDFIHYVSYAVLQNNGMIYQYVGDEIVVTWSYSKKNILKSINTVTASRRALQNKMDYFKRMYGVVPDFRVGLHAGDVTIGEIGVQKKILP